MVNDIYLFMITKPKQNDYKPHELREIIVEAAKQNLPDVTRSQIADVLGIRRESVHRIENRNKKKSVADKALHHLAIRAVKDNLKRIENEITVQKVTQKGEIVDIIVIEKPSFSNQLEAARLVLDRAEPIKQADSGSGQSISFTQVNINQAYINSREPIKPMITPNLAEEVEGSSKE